MTWLITMLALTGNVLVIRKSRYGFACWATSNVYLSWHNFSIGEAAQGALFVVYFALAIYGFLQWKSETKFKIADNRT